MSRANASGISQTAQANSSADQTAATTALTAENADINNYESQLSQYAAKNPYTDGGAFQTAQNQSLAGTADAGSSALTNTLQTQAKRTGQNATAANATAAEAARANQRTLATGEADATTQRIGDEANYNAGVLQDTTVPINAEHGVYTAATGGADSSLNTATSANAQDPSFWDQFGAAAAKGLPGLFIQGDEDAGKIAQGGAGAGG